MMTGEWAVPQSTRWVSLSHATALLGVNQSTVRRWADTGVVRAYRTPGGHRRLSEADLLAITETGPERLRSAVSTRIQRDFVHGRLAPWRRDVGIDDGEALRTLGRRLLQLVADAIVQNRPQSAIEREFDEIGREYGAILVKAQMALPTAIEAFTFFRRSLDETARLLAERRELEVAEAVLATRNIALLADRVLAGLAAAYAGAGPATALAKME